MQVNFSAFTPTVLDAQPPALGTPRTFFEMLLFSVTVSVITQVIVHQILKPR